ncbi:RNA methyltransferase [bacterium]|nr:RNA methyltransferase [bacterium]
MKMNELYIVLMHYPMVSNDGIITTAVTNLDIHDIARVAATYDVGGYIIVHPDPSYRSFTKTLVSHWTERAGGRKNPDRKEALEKVSVVASLEEGIEIIKNRTKQTPLVAATTARHFPTSKSLEEVVTLKQPIAFLFGTGGGMTESFLQKSDIIIEPIETGSNYNHLSVRSAVSIFIDRTDRLCNISD